MFDNFFTINFIRSLQKINSVTIEICTFFCISDLKCFLRPKEEEEEEEEDVVSEEEEEAMEEDGDDEGGDEGKDYFVIQDALKKAP